MSSDEIERVARAICISNDSGDPDDPCTHENVPRWSLWENEAKAALAAMRPVSVDPVKLAEIRARHEHLDGQLSKRTTEITAYEGYSAHADRAFLLSVIEGVSHDD